METHVRAVIFDLDGTILDTETLAYQAGVDVLRSHGAKLTRDVARLGIGKRPVDCWEAIRDKLGLEVTAEQLVQETEPILREQWHTVRTLPGANRLISHLKDLGLPLAVATSTPRQSFNAKVAKHTLLQTAFDSVVCGDEVTNGKPAPDLFLKAATALNVAPEHCLVIEDAPSGIEAALAAGMRAIAVPSLVDKVAYAELDVPVIPSLLAFDPSVYGLAPFKDVIADTVPLEEPWRLSGPVVKGFGRGSKDLGIRTANLSEDAIAKWISEAVTGIYYGWARVMSGSAVHPMVMSVGYNPFYSNSHKTCEPWILADFEEDFYGEELRLVVCGYVRPEADFTTMEHLIERIHKDADVTKVALEHPNMARHASDAFLTAPGR